MGPMIVQWRDKLSLLFLCIIFSLSAMQQSNQTNERTLLHLLPVELHGKIFFNYNASISSKETIISLLNFYRTNPAISDSVEFSKSAFSYLIDVCKIDNYELHDTANSFLYDHGILILKKQEMAQWIENQAAKLLQESNLRQAARDVNIERMKAILEQETTQINIDASNWMSFNTLAYVAFSIESPAENRMAEFECMLLAGADPNIVYCTGQTTLSYIIEQAIRQESIKELEPVIALFLKHKANANLGKVTIEKESPRVSILNAVKEYFPNHHALIQLLKDHGAQDYQDIKCEEYCLVL
jgi:hypothetical protein